MTRLRSRWLFDYSKRVFDIVVSGLALLLLAPLLSMVALLVAIRLGRPVLFRQGRPGIHGRTFELVKFRTMRSVDAAMGYVSNEERMTPFGARLRSWSIDELPSLWNVFKGDMSLVGPRPLLVEYLPLYTHEQSRRHEVRPGLTGLAQVNGRNALGWDNRFMLDVQYVEARSWRVDLGILLSTVRKVVNREGISTEGHVVGAPFAGSTQGGEK